MPSSQFVKRAFNLAGEATTPRGGGGGGGDTYRDGRRVCDHILLTLIFKVPPVLLSHPSCQMLSCPGRIRQTAEEENQSQQKEVADLTPTPVQRARDRRARRPHEAAADQEIAGGKGGRGRLDARRSHKGREQKYSEMIVVKLEFSEPIRQCSGRRKLLHFEAQLP